MKPAVLVARRFDRFSLLLNENGFETINLALVKTVAIADSAELDARLAEIENYDGVFLTSPAAAEVFLRRFQGGTFGGKIYVLGGRINRLLEPTGLKTVYLKNANTIEEFLESFPPEEFAGKKFLFPRGDKSLRAIPETVGKIATVDETIVYRTIKPETDRRFLNDIKERISRKELLAVCFFSPSAVENFLKTFGAFRQKNIKVAAIGATTARAAEAENLTVDFVSPRATAEEFARGLVGYLKSID